MVEAQTLRERVARAICSSVWEGADAAIAIVLEEAARLVETSAYRTASSGAERFLEPSDMAKHDMHHATIAAAIRALGGAS